MQRSHGTFTTACTFGLALISAGASAQRPTFHEHPDVVLDGPGSRSVRRTARADSTLEALSGQVSTTPDNQILVALAPEDTAAANLFDLNDRTLVFTPDGHGGYSRSVRSVAWEDDIGPEVADGAQVDLQSFQFDFAGHRWGSFFVSRHGLLTFGGPFTYDYWDAANRFGSMRDIFNDFATIPTISALYKPTNGARQHVASWPDRVVVTWITAESEFYQHAVPPDDAVRFQGVLGADGSVRFNYPTVAFGDGIVGLFPAEGITKGDLIASIADAADAELPGHLDLLEVALFESNAEGVILEFTTRDAIPVPPSDTFYSYRLYFDTDEPFWTRYGDGSDMDFMWSVDVEADGGYRMRGGSVLPREAANRVSMLATIDEDLARLSAEVIADAARFTDGRFVKGQNSRPARIRLPAARSTTDLSSPDPLAGNRHSEAFHHRGRPDLDEIACRVIGVLGDQFDVLVFHMEFRVDSQESGAAWTRYGQNVDVEGIGDIGSGAAPCGEGRLKGHWESPVWMRSKHVFAERRFPDQTTGFDRGLLLFAHELTHAWTARASYLRNGEPEPLYGNYCRCHWRPDLHLPAAFPWDPNEAGPRSLMGGRYWRDNGDGTFTPLDGYLGGGHSWLDLYMAGLADASEVPDMFILRNLKPVREGDDGQYTADKEIVSIEQVVAAEGPREPAAADAQTVFNAGFVYLLEPGRRPDDDLLRLHAEYRDKVLEHWFHITGGRSQIATAVPGSPNGSPVAAVATLPDLTLRVGGTAAVVDVPSAFRDPDGDRLTYRVASSAPAVAAAVVTGSQEAVTPVSAGAATITVTATDTGGSSAMQRFAVSVLAPRTFTDHPVRPGTTPIRAVHFRELRERIAALRVREGLPVMAWTDPRLVAGVTPVKRVHLTELRWALDATYDAVRRSRPAYTDGAVTAGVKAIRAAHIMELRNAVLALESDAEGAP